MVATDTVVGIAGATVLALVMVGVFVYEYNNPPLANGNGGNGGGVDNTASIARFTAAHAALNATGDMDHDGISNHLDRDMDGNGVDDLNQTGNLLVTVSFTGSISAPTPPASSSTSEFAFNVESGNEGLAVAFYYNTTAPAPLPRSPTLDVKVLGPDGATVVPAPTATQSGTAVSSQASTTESQVAGAYKVVVTETVPGPPTSYGGHLVLDYGKAHV